MRGLTPYESEELAKNSETNTTYRRSIGPLIRSRFSFFCLHQHQTDVHFWNGFSYYFARESRQFSISPCACSELRTSNLYRNCPLKHSIVYCWTATIGRCSCQIKSRHFLSFCDPGSTSCMYLIHSWEVKAGFLVRPERTVDKKLFLWTLLEL